jgi:hypothetical protein
MRNLGDAWISEVVFIFLQLLWARGNGLASQVFQDHRLTKQLEQSLFLSDLCRLSTSMGNMRTWESLLLSNSFKVRLHTKHVDIWQGQAYVNVIRTTKFYNWHTSHWWRVNSIYLFSSTIRRQIRAYKTASCNCRLYHDAFFIRVRVLTESRRLHHITRRNSRAWSIL